MGTGIKVAVINQIKEYAEQKAYDKALTLIRQQDLSQSYNSQFVRICGEVLLYTKNYEECRKVLIMAHKIAPEGNRIIYDLIQLYIETGETDLADKYYEQYVFNATEHDTDLPWLNYMIARSKRASGQELYTALEPLYTQDRADYIAYEFMRIFQWMGETEKFEVEYRYIFDNFRDSEYKKKAKHLKEENCAAQELFIYPENSILQHDDKLDADETVLLEQDYFRMHPKEPEIVLMADDYDAQDDQSIAWKIWSQRRREKAEQKAAARAEKKAAKQAKKEAEAAEKQKAEQEKTETSKEQKTEQEKTETSKEQKAEQEKTETSEEQKTEQEATEVSEEQKTEQEATEVSEEQKTEQEATEVSEEQEQTADTKEVQMQTEELAYEAEAEHEEGGAEEPEYETEAEYEEAGIEEPAYEAEAEYEKSGAEEPEYEAEAEYEEAGIEEPEYEAEAEYEESGAEEPGYEAEAEYEEAGIEEPAYEAETEYEESGAEESGYEAEAEYEEAEIEEPEQAGTLYQEEIYVEVSPQEDMQAYETVIDINAPISYDFSSEEEDEEEEDEETNTDTAVEPDKHQQAFNEYDELLKKEEARLVDQFEREAKLLKEAESLLASVQSGVDDWNSQKVNNLFEAFDMEYKDAINKKKDSVMKYAMEKQKTVSDKAAEEVQEGVQTNTKPQESSFENSFESLSAKKTEVEALAQRVEKIQNGNREDLELKEKKPHVELREHTKSMLSLDVRKKDILKQLKERR